MTPEELNARASSPGEEYELQTPDSLTYDVDRDSKVVAWRLRCFEAAGMDELNASALAVRRDVDRVEVERLLASGATPTQAVELLT